MVTHLESSTTIRDPLKKKVDGVWYLRKQHSKLSSDLRIMNTHTHIKKHTDTQISSVLLRSPPSSQAHTPNQDNCNRGPTSKGKLHFSNGVLLDKLTTLQDRPHAQE